MNIAFAGLRHDHIYVLYEEAKNHKEYNIVGEFEDNKEAREKAIEKGLECKYKSFEELISDETVETVALGGCFGDRGEMAEKALLAGKNVIADKPLCTSIKQLKKIEKAAKKSGKMVSCMFTMRYSKSFAAFKKLVESKALGEINNVYYGGQHPLMYGRRPKWYFEEGKHGGTINDIAIHAIDILNYALGLKVKDINSARCWNKYAKDEPDFKDSAQLMLTAENGAGIVADVSYAIPDGVEFNLPYYWKFFVWGTEGTAEFTEGCEEITYYVKGNPNPQIIKGENPECDYLTDFLKMVNGEDAILPMEDVFYATRKTLMMQKKAKQ